MPDIFSAWTDIKLGNWVDHYLPDFVRPYARLMRLDRPIGTWLLLWPCWWGVALASTVFPNLWLMLLFGIGAVVMRGAGCVVNDIYDRNLDKQVERTRTRPLANGDIQLWQAIVFLIVLLLIGLGILLLFNRASIIIGACSLFLVFSYPLMKRITWWPQLFLGFTFNWGALMGWSAVTGSLDFPPVLLYIAGIFWTLGYDTIYAYQDIRDDALVGIKSTARLFDELFNERGMAWICGFYTAAIFLLLLTGASCHEGWGFYGLMLGAGGYITIQLASWDMENREDCLKRFCSNRDFGAIVFAAIILGKWF